MSKIKPERAHSKQVFTTFEGVEAGGADEMRNFRILADGSIEKRCGWRVSHSTEETLRGVWKGVIGGMEQLFAVGGTHIHRLTENTQDPICTLTTSTGRAHFFEYRDRLYLADGARIYVYRPDRNDFAEAMGYAPLYGSNWHPINFGDVYESPNLFCNRLRINYANTTATQVFRLPYYAASVDSVRIDGVRDTAFLLSAAGDSVTVSRVGSDVEIAFTVLWEREQLAHLKKAALSHVGKSKEREFLLLSSGEDCGAAVYCSAPVDENALAEARVAYYDTDPLYFRSDGVLSVGDAWHPVTAYHPDNGRVLAFWANGAASISVSSEGTGVECYTLPLTMGNRAKGLTLSLENDPVILNDAGLFRLQSSVGEPDHFYPDLLCPATDLPFPTSSFDKVIGIVDPVHGELWLRNPSITNSTVWVYACKLKQRYCFDNVIASFFYCFDGLCGFASGSNLCVFEEALTTDNGRAFQAVYRSAFLCFSSPESVKRSLRVTLCGFGAEARLELESEKKSRIFTVVSPSQDAPICLDKRARFGRFRHLRFCLRDFGTERSRWSRLSLYSNL